jgi:soluble lytic murein transglycosylase
MGILAVFRQGSMHKIVSPLLALGFMTLVSHAENKPAVKQDESSITTQAILVARHDDKADMPAAKEAIYFYKSGRIDDGDAHAAKITNPVWKLAAEWAAIRSSYYSLGTARLRQFLRSDPDFAHRSFVQKKLENALFAERAGAGETFDFFDRREPEMAAGKLIVAMHLRDKGFGDIAIRHVRDTWRTKDVPADIELAILKEFPDAITDADHFHRAQKLVLKGQTGLGIRAALRVSADHAALMAQLSIALSGKGSIQRQIDKVPPNMRGKPVFSLMRAIELRRSDRHADAARLLLATPRDAQSTVEGDEWWKEERALVRGLLTAREDGLAYKIAASASATGPAATAEAEFLAGFIALRRLKQASTADMHFLRSREAAREPANIARAEYWLGRAREALYLPAKAHFEAAAKHSSNYYGQIAAAHAGIALSVAHAKPTPEQRAAVAALPDTRVLRGYLTMGEIDLAMPLAHELAASFSSAGEVAAVADILAETRQTKHVLSLGRRNIARGLPVVEAAFPLTGIPAFEPADGSAGLALVYAVARQESAFDPRAVSRADARGLMQMLPATARVTARRFNIPYSPDDLLSNPAINAKLGAAHLGELAMSTRGNIPMMLAAYNAGPRRMNEWIADYGDPRDPASIDPIDWVELVPFNETRGYIQKVMENLQVYRLRLSPSEKRTILDDLAEGHRRKIEIIGLP